MLKRIRNTILLMLFAAINGNAYTVLTAGGAITETDSIPKTIRKVERLTNGTKVTYEFGAALLISDQLKENAYYPLLDGFGQTDTEHMPWVPIRVDKFSVSDSIDCEISVLESDWIDVSLTISPSRASLPQISEFVYTSENLPRVSPINMMMPYDLVTDIGTEVYRDTQIKSVMICPIQYNPIKKIVRFFRRFSYLVSEPKSEVSSMVSKERSRKFFDDPIFSGLVNYETDIFPFRPTGPNLNTFFSESRPKSYLIIAHENVRWASQELYWWKQWQGYGMTLEVRKEWTSESIKAAVKKFKEDNYDTAYFVLLAGDEKLIPPCTYTNPYFDKNGKRYEDINTDLDYFLLDGPGDNLPDLYYGRIPASNEIEMKAIVNKIINYERDPNVNKNTTSFVAAAEFEDIGPKDNVEDRYFCSTTETIAQSLEPVFDNFSRLYYSNNDVYPAGWKSDIIGLEFPEYLRDESIWRHTPNDVVDEINNGANIILHRGHGIIEGWWKPNFKVSYFQNLTNEVTPFIFSINCRSGQYYSDNNFTKKYYVWIKLVQLG